MVKIVLRVFNCEASLEVYFTRSIALFVYCRTPCFVDLVLTFVDDSFPFARCKG